ncbi:MAG: phage terminase large subunit [Acidobacteria bacterium]|nr:phage terminase large subunit [Acidobacteriota bacterium]
MAGWLDRVVAGSVDRVIIQAPPQHGKSRLASVGLPTVWMGHHPDQPIIMASYGSSLSTKHSREVQEAVDSPAFREVFGDGIELHPKQRSVFDWRLRGRRGGLVASGVGGAITGRGALLGIIDDPFKNWQEAYSARIRDNVWTWYESTFLTRIWERGRVVIMTTRWHEDDLVGRLLKAEPDRWVVLNYPALNEDDKGKALAELPGWRPDSLGRRPGEALAPSRFSREYLERRRDAMGPLVWAALFQQRPTTGTGGVFPTEKLGIIDVLDESKVARRVRAWDLATTPEGTAPDPDYTVGVYMVELTEGPCRWAVVDVQRGRWSSTGVDSTVVRTAQRDGRGVHVRFEEEPGSAGRARVDSLTRALAGFAVSRNRPTGSKLVRALPMASQMGAGHVAIVRAPWNHAFIAELRGDDSGHDDQVDAACAAFEYLAGGSTPVAVGRMTVEEDPLTRVERFV